MKCLKRVVVIGVLMQQLVSYGETMATLCVHGGVYDQFVEVKYPTMMHPGWEVWEGIAHFAPCPKGEWDPRTKSYCGDPGPGRSNYQILQTGMKEAGPGVYQYEVSLKFSPLAGLDDPFCPPPQDTKVVVTTYDSELNYKAVLLAATEERVIGVLYEQGSNSWPPASLVYMFIAELPCEVWNDIVQNNETYKGEGFYYDCKNSSKK